jgi:hypothetical protein
MSAPRAGHAKSFFQSKGMASRGMQICTRTKMVVYGTRLVVQVHVISGIHKRSRSVEWKVWAWALVESPMGRHALPSILCNGSLNVTPC